MSAPRALQCSLCGGTVPPPLGGRRVVCSFCGRALYYTADDFIPSLVIEPEVPQDKLRENVQRLLRHPYLPADVRHKALLVRARRSYIPFYLLAGKRGGVLQAGKERIVTKARSLMDRVETGYNLPARSVTSTRVETVREEDSRVVLGDYLYLYAASALRGWDIRDDELRGLVMERLQKAVAAAPEEMAKQGEVIAPDIPLALVVEKGVASFERGGELKVLDQHVFVIYVPVVTFTFRYGRELYSVVAEELSGQPLSGYLPFRRDWGLLIGIPLVGVIGYLTGLFLRALGFLPFASIGKSGAAPHLLIFLGILLTGATALVTTVLSAAWSLIRRPYRVAVVPEGPRLESSGDAISSPLQPVTSACVAIIKALVRGNSRD